MKGGIPLIVRGKWLLLIMFVWTCPLGLYAQDAPASPSTSPVPTLIVMPTVEPVADVVDETTVPPPPEPQAEEPAATEAPVEAPADTPEPSAETPEETGSSVYVDPEFGMLPPVSDDPDATGSSAAAEGWKPKFDFGGELRTRLGQDLAYEYALVRETPESKPEARGMEDVIDWRSSIQFWTRLEISENIQVFMELYAEHAVVGKRNEDNPTVIFNGSDYRHSYRLEPWEAYFDLFFGPFDLRIGNQIVSWGTLAVMSPSDRINPRDPGSYYWADISGAREPIPAVKGTYHVEGLNFELVWIPFFQAPPNDLFGGDYSLLRYGSVYGFVTNPLIDLNHYIDQSKTLASYPNLLTTKTPDANPVNSQLGFRFSGSKKGVDFGLSYLFAYDQIPTSDLDPELRALGAAVLANDTNLITGYTQNIIDRLTAGESLHDLAQAEYKRKHSVAAEFGTTIWELGVKAEIAFIGDKTYYTREMNPSDHHTLAYAAGIDVLKTDLGALSTFYLDLELYGSILFGVDANEPLIFSTEKNIGLFANARLAFLDDDLEFEVSEQTQFSTQEFVLIPKVTYSPVQDLKLTLGLMLLEAWANEPKGFDRFTSNPDSKDTLFGQFSENDQIFFTLRYMF